MSMSISIISPLQISSTLTSAPPHHRRISSSTRTQTPVAPPSSVSLNPNDLNSTPLPSLSCALQCPHFQSCSGCSFEYNLHRPSVVDEAVDFFKRLGVLDFTFDTCRLYGWRCRAKLAVRGSSTNPLIGLYQEGTHNVVDIPQCKAHHPSINAAIELLRKGITELDVEPFDEDLGTGELRYVQMAVTTHDTSLPFSERYRNGKVQVSLVWNARSETSPGCEKLNDLASFLWRKGGERSNIHLIHSVWGNFQTSKNNLDQKGQKLYDRYQRLTVEKRLAGCLIMSLADDINISTDGIISLLACKTIIRIFCSVNNPTDSGILPVTLDFQKVSQAEIEARIFDIIFGNRWRHLFGERDFWENVGGIDVYLTPSSFGQANTRAFDSLLRKLQKYVPNGSSVVDLYGGAGVIGLSLAATKKSRSVKCIEINKDSKQCFEKTMSRLPNAVDCIMSWHQADASFEPASWLVGSDVVVVDPPRKGLDESLLYALQTISSAKRKANTLARSPSKLKEEKRPWILREREESISVESKTSWPESDALPQTLVYISCGWDSFKKDCKLLLSNKAWYLDKAHGFNFFPGTESMEVLAIFKRDPDTKSKKKASRKKLKKP